MSMMRSRSRSRLTRRSAARLLDLALSLDRLPLTRAALAAGLIDERRAEIIAEELAGLDDEHAAAVEKLIIGKAPRLTSGQLRALVRRAVLSADPAGRPAPQRQGPEGRPGGDVPRNLRHRRPVRPRPAPRRRAGRRQAPHRPGPGPQSRRDPRHPGHPARPRLPPPALRPARRHPHPADRQPRPPRPRPTPRHRSTRQHSTRQRSTRQPQHPAAQHPAAPRPVPVPAAFPGCAARST